MYDKRFNSLSTAKEIEQFCVDFWISKLLVDCNCWKTLDVSYLTATDPLSKSRITRAIQNEINSMVRMYNNNNGAGEEISISETNEEEWLESNTGVSLKNGLCDRYIQLKKLLHQPIPAIPKSMADVFADQKKWLEHNGLFQGKLKTNMTLLANTFALSEDEVTVFTFLLLIKDCSPLRDALNCFDYTDKGIVLIRQIAAKLLNLSEDKVSKIISNTGRLCDSGLIDRFDGSNYSRDIEDNFHVADSFTTSSYLWGELNQEELLARYVQNVPRSEVCLTDFNYLPEISQTLLPYLEQLRHNKKSGVNILLYGPAGTGKTQLSRLLGEQAGYHISEVKTHNDGYEENNRFHLWKAAGEILRNANDTLLVVDEAEDIFSIGFSEGSGGRFNKGYINQSLETNPCPTIWLSNSLQFMDSAMIRRFNFVVKVETPPRTQMKNLAESLFQDVLSAANINRIIDTSSLSPGVLTQVADIANDLKNQCGRVDENYVMKMIQETLTAQGYGRLAEASTRNELYDPSLTNTQTNLRFVVEALKRSRKGRLCLYGPSGTGKTAFAQWIADQLGKPLLVKRASDILGMYVGQSEANIRSAFEEAKKNDAVLLMDEADSFLRDRTMSSQSWEVTQVNELLTQMESFEGIFVATTNLMDIVDVAALRRFDFKAKFDFLKPEQSIELFKRYANKWKFEDSGVFD